MKQGEFELLSKQFATPQAVMTEIINLKAIQGLPKGTEHFLSDLHGESEIFLHILRNASGVIRTKIDLALGKSVSEDEKNKLAALIYYPEEYLSRTPDKEKTSAFYAEILRRLIEVIKLTTAKYTRSKVRKAIPTEYRYIIDELINMPYHSISKAKYYNGIIREIIELGNAENFIIRMSYLIQRLAIDRLHVVGDIYDRGNGAPKIIDKLAAYHSLDIEWGNHDILWMGAFFGNAALICNLLRINCLYRNLQVIENYGINLRPLMSFALEEYADDDCEKFVISDLYGIESELERNAVLRKMTKAVTVLQLKLENELIRNHREFGMDDRILLESDGLTDKEKELVNYLIGEFSSSKRLSEHIDFLLKKGSMYKVFNGNLIMHGCVPTEENGEFSLVPVGDERYSGKKLYDKLNVVVKNAARGDKYAVDYTWYLWCGKKSPLFGRDKMRTYEKYFGGSLCEKEDSYYNFVKTEEFCLKVLNEFGANGKYAVIVNGHKPVRVKDGEMPESGNCRHITIDGGLSKAYSLKTGIGGYTLISNSEGLYLVSHESGFSVDGVFQGNSDLKSSNRLLKKYDKRILVKETDDGKAMDKQIQVLKGLLKYYNQK